MTSDVVAQLRDALHTVAQARNAGNGTVSSSDVDYLLDTARAAVEQLSGCEVCGQVGRPVRTLSTTRDGGATPSVPTRICLDMERCYATCDADDARAKLDIPAIQEQYANLRSLVSHAAAGDQASAALMDGAAVTCASQIPGLLAALGHPLPQEQPA